MEIACVAETFKFV